MKDLHGWIQPPRPSFIPALRLIELLDLLLKDIEDAAGRVAGFELASEWVRGKMLLCAFFVRFQSIIENWLEVGRCGSGVSLRHKGEVRDRGEDSRMVGDG